MLKPKNIIIFVVAGVILLLIYIFFINKAPQQTGLVSTSPSGVASTTDTSSNVVGGQDFLSTLLNVKNIKLDASILSNISFTSLRDSSITLTPDGTEGRTNPFAPIGIDNSTQQTTTTTTTTTPVTAPVAPTTPKNTTPKTKNTTPPPTTLPPSTTSPVTPPTN